MQYVRNSTGLTHLRAQSVCEEGMITEPTVVSIAVDPDSQLLSVSSCLLASRAAILAERSASYQDRAQYDIFVTTCMAQVTPGASAVRYDDEVGDDRPFAADTDVNEQSDSDSSIYSDGEVDPDHRSSTYRNFVCEHERGTHTSSVTPPMPDLLNLNIHVATDAPRPTTLA